MSFISTKAGDFFDGLLWMFVCPIEFISNLFLSDLALKSSFAWFLTITFENNVKVNYSDKLEMDAKFPFFLEGILGKKKEV